MKKIIAILLASMMLLPLASCAKDDTNTADTGTKTPDTTVTAQAPENNEPELVGTKYALNNTATWVKTLDPRMEATDSLITCDWSAAGIEFTATCKGDVVFEVNADTNKGGGVEGCYFRAYVDDEAYLNGETPYYEANGKTYITLKDLTEGTHTIRLVKATGYTLANVDLISVTVDGTVGETAPAANDVLIEFVGDNSACGWGLVGSFNGAYTAQDATLAYPYLIADTLGTDYSILALSGQGILKGNPGITGAYKYASHNRSQDTEYAFSRQADVIVINAETCDASDNFAAATYAASLKTFVETVREKNGEDAHIILVSGLEKDTYTADVKNLVNQLGGAASKYYFYMATAIAGEQLTVEENVTCASELGGMIQSILDGTYSEGEKVTIPTNMVKIYEQKFDNVSAENVAALATGLSKGNENVLVTSNGKRALLSDFEDAEIKAFNQLLSNSFGWKATAIMDYDFRNGGMATKDHPVIVNNGAVTFNGGGSTYQAVAPGTLANYDVYTIDMDISIESLGMFTIFFNNTADVGYYNGTAQGLNFRDITNGAITGTGKAGAGALSVQLFGFSHAADAHTGTITYPASDASKFVDTGAKYGETFHLTLLVNNTDGTVNVFVNGELIALYTNELTHTKGGGVEFMFQNSNVTIDNLVVSVVEKTA